MRNGGFSTVSWPIERIRSALSMASCTWSRSESAAVPIHRWIGCPVGAPAVVPLPIWVVKNGSCVRARKSPSMAPSRGRLAAAPSMTRGCFACRIMSAARSNAAGCASGSSTGCTGTRANSRSFLGRDVLGQLEVHRPGPFLRGRAEGVAHDRRDTGDAADLSGELRQRLHDGHHVDDLETGLLAAPDRLLAGHHDHRHGSEMGVGRTRGQVQRTRSQGAEAHPGTAGEPSVGGGHERRGLFVAGENEFDARRAKRLDGVEVLLAGNTEDPLDALVLERGNETCPNLWSYP